MTSPDPIRPSALADHAADQLAFIRDTMVRAGRFTAVSGVGMMLAGAVGTTTALVTPQTKTPEQRLGLWLVAAMAAIALSLISMVRKARRSRQSLSAGPARTFALALAPALVVGFLFTIALVRAELWDLLPGAWLCCYGAGVVSGGAFSVRAVPVFGVVIVALGAAALFLPPATHTWLLGAGFGVTHLLFGFFIARYHGG